MSDYITSIPRRVFELTPAQTAQIEALSTSIPAPSDAEIQVINQFWMERGAEMGFKWTTVADGALLVGRELPTYGFTAEVEKPIAAEVFDHEALDWIDRSYPSDPSDPDDAPSRQRFDRTALMVAFNAGRDHGFTMGSAAPQPAEPAADRHKAAWEELWKHLSWLQAAGRVLCDEAGMLTWGKNLGEIATQLIVNAYPNLRQFAPIAPTRKLMLVEVDQQMRMIQVLAEAAGLFREYEQHHRERMTEAKSGAFVHANFTKAERNGDMAARIERLLNGVEADPGAAGQAIRPDVPVRAAPTRTNEGLTYPHVDAPALHCFSGSNTDWAWQNIGEILLPASHPYYLATSRGFTYWPGAESAPADWDQGNVLLEDGRELESDWGLRWYRTDLGTDLIGYRRKSEAAVVGIISGGQTFESLVNAARENGTLVATGEVEATPAETIRTIEEAVADGLVPGLDPDILEGLRASAAATTSMDPVAAKELLMGAGWGRPPEAEPFAITLQDPRFDPSKPVMINGFAYAPMKVPA